VNIYVETNFVLEIAFEQEQYPSCEKILKLCEADQAQLIIPAYSLAEPHEKLFRQARSRQELQLSLDKELRQLSRKSSYASRIKNIQSISSLIVQSSEEERHRFIQCRERLLQIGEIVSLTTDVLIAAADCENIYDLSP
jgi:hypothetical protein